MKLITETFFDINGSVVILDEATGKKQHFLEGIYLQSESKNRNGRIYPKSILKREVDRYITEKIDTNMAIGELNHPDYPEPDPKQASHRIVSLKEQGNDFLYSTDLVYTVNR